MSKSQNMSHKKQYDWFDFWKYPTSLIKTNEVNMVEVSEHKPWQYCLPEH